MRFRAFFVGLCMVIIAASLGVVAYLGLGLSAVESAAGAVAALSVLASASALTSRATDHADLSDRIADLSQGTADLARQVGELGRRVITAEAAVAQLSERTRSATDPLASEMEVLGTLVKQMAETLATHEAVLLDQTAPSPAAPMRHERAAEAPVAVSRPLDLDDTDESPGDGEMLGVVRSALEANRLDLYLQPIVTLPQRKVRFYEAMTRLRTADGGLLLPADYLGQAESGGLMPLLDNLMLFRSVQVVRRLTTKNREAGLFCNIAGSTLVDSEFFPQFYEFVSANKALAPALVFEFGQATWRNMGPIEHDSMAQLAELGFRFSLDQVTDLQIDPRKLVEQGFRFVKVPATLLLNRNVSAAADIHPTDLSNLLSRYGIELIAEKIETEGTVIDLLDYEVRFGQGFLFAPPRPVRGEVFQGMSERALRPTATPGAPAAAAVPPPPVAAPAPAASMPVPNLLARIKPAAEQPAPPPAESDPEMSGLVKLARAFGRRVQAG